ncbi:MAG: IS1380 family transposase, partial [Treponema sp.]|nr:IS1380 family transposase [Treponema sp.]
MIKIETTTERIESKSGLLLAGKLAIKAGLHNIHSAVVKNAAAIIISLYGLMMEGKTDFESMKEKRGSLFFKEALNLSFVYAKETVRLYLDDMACEADRIVEQLRECSDSLISKAPLSGLWIEGRKYLPVDIDTSVLDNSKTKKEGVSRTYQGYDGYHPIFAYLGKEGYMLDCELRP